MAIKFWKFEQEHNSGRAWNGRLDFWRLEIGYHLYRHEYPSSPDRWVFKPWITYDSKRKSAPTTEPSDKGDKNGI